MDKSVLHNMTFGFIICIVCIFCTKWINCSPNHYEGFKLLRLKSYNSSAIDYIRKLEYDYPDDFSLWNTPRSPGQPIYLMASPNHPANQLKLLSDYNVTMELVIDNLYKEILREKRENRVLRLSNFVRTGRRRPYYKNFEELNSTLDQIAHSRSFITLDILGYTAEGRPLKGLMISMDSSKPIIWIDAGIHAREWIAPAAAMTVIYKLLRPNGQNLLKDYQFYIVPLVNPDGYEYTHSKFRFWRKNRAPNDGEVCLGTDLNRNFPFKWGVGTGASPNACSDTYRGREANSELETQALVKKLDEHKDKIILYLSLHSFGQYILTPYGFSRYQFPPFYKQLIAMGQRARDAIHYRHGYVYQVGSSSELLYEAPGAADDYVAGHLRVPYTYTIELCDEGRYGFLLPPSYIGHVGRQLWTAIKIFVENM